MTYHHFINVAALAFAPYWIFYKARISAQSETKSILMGAGFYLFAQFLELITLATFVSGGSGGQTTLNGSGSLLHIVQSRLIGLIHVAGLVVALAVRHNYPRTQVAYGWALSSALLSRLFPLWNGAKSLQWSFAQIVSAIDCNIDLLDTLTISVLVAKTARDLKKSPRKLLMNPKSAALILLLRVVLPMLTSTFLTDLWFGAVAIRLAMSVFVSFVASSIFPDISKEDKSD